ncbi:MAG: hypothetical protein DRQ64_00035 [Gammaproteobacteria bacterium]|nr:MAG: hypothetical protein DRQ64_00035 [Gammaproteobacteria bacterium]
MPDEKQDQNRQLQQQVAKVEVEEKAEKAVNAANSSRETIQSLTGTMDSMVEVLDSTHHTGESNYAHTLVRHQAECTESSWFSKCIGFKGGDPRSPEYAVDPWKVAGFVGTCLFVIGTGGLGGFLVVSMANKAGQAGGEEAVSRLLSAGDAGEPDQLEG